MAVYLISAHIRIEELNAFKVINAMLVTIKTLCEVFNCI